MLCGSLFNLLYFLLSVSSVLSVVSPLFVFSLFDLGVLAVPFFLADG